MTDFETLIVKKSLNESSEWKRGYIDGLKLYEIGFSKNFDYKKLMTLSAYEIAKELGECGNIYIDHLNLNYLRTYIYPDHLAAWDSYSELCVQSLLSRNGDCSDLVHPFIRQRYKWLRHVKSIGKEKATCYQIFQTFNLEETPNMRLFLDAFNEVVGENFYRAANINYTIPIQDIQNFAIYLALTDPLNFEEGVNFIYNWSINKDERTFGEFYEAKWKNRGKMTVKESVMEKTKDWKDGLISGSQRGLVKAFKNEFRDFLAEQMSKGEKKGYKEFIKKFLSTKWGDLFVYSIMSEAIKPVGDFVKIPEEVITFVSQVSKEEVGSDITEFLAGKFMVAGKELLLLVRERLTNLSNNLSAPSLLGPKSSETVINFDMKKAEVISK